MSATLYRSIFVYSVSDCLRTVYEDDICIVDKYHEDRSNDKVTKNMIITLAITFEPDVVDTSGWVHNIVLFLIESHIRNVVPYGISFV